MVDDGRPLGSDPSFPEFDSQHPGSYNLQKGKTMETIDHIASLLTEGKDYAYVDNKVLLSEDVILRVTLAATMAVIINGAGDAMTTFSGLMLDLLKAIDRKR